MIGTTGQRGRGDSAHGYPRPKACTSPSTAILAEKHKYRPETQTNTEIRACCSTPLVHEPGLRPHQSLITLTSDGDCLPTSISSRLRCTSASSVPDPILDRIPMAAAAAAVALLASPSPATLAMAAWSLPDTPQRVSLTPDVMSPPPHLYSAPLRPDMGPTPPPHMFKAPLPDIRASRRPEGRASSLCLYPRTGPP